jgi:hypothetical protein
LGIKDKRLPAETQKLHLGFPARPELSSERINELVNDIMREKF